MKKSPLNQQKKPQLKAYAKYSAMAFQMIAAIGLGMWGGRKIDGYMKNEFPAFTLILSLLGLVVSLWIVIRTALKDN
ncbi:MAG: AtpZ/AtpI family protein [Bacteroidetes bacterium]|nr:AtpZ/AtpI family protein [Bacteroidota bacterium]